MYEKNLFQDSLPPDSVEIADEVSVKSLTSRTRSCWLRGHGVSTVVDYADTVLAKMLILRTNFDEKFGGLSLTLKELSVKIKYLGVFTYPIYNIFKI